MAVQWLLASGGQAPAPSSWVSPSSPSTWPAAVPLALRGRDVLVVDATGFAAAMATAAATPTPTASSQAAAAFMASAGSTQVTAASATAAANSRLAALSKVSLARLLTNATTTAATPAPAATAAPAQAISPEVEAPPALLSVTNALEASGVAYEIVEGTVGAMPATGGRTSGQGIETMLKVVSV